MTYAHISSLDAHVLVQVKTLNVPFNSYSMLYKLRVKYTDEHFAKFFCELRIATRGQQNNKLKG